DVADTTPPTVTGTSLPAEGTTSTAVHDRLSVSFSEDMAAATVNNPASYDLRAAGPDGNFDTADDLGYHLATAPTYTSGSTASLSISDGPLQPGSYRFTARTTLTDRVGNAVVNPFVRNFVVDAIPPYIIEDRSNDAIGLATSLSATPSSTPDGTLGMV